MMAAGDYAGLRRRYEAYLMLERGLADNTRRNYLSDIDRFADYRGRDCDFNAVTPEDIETFLADLHDLGIGIDLHRIFSVYDRLTEFYRRIV